MITPKKAEKASGSDNDSNDDKGKSQSEGERRQVTQISSKLLLWGRLGHSRKEVNIQLIDILRFANGQFVEHWGVTDMACMMEQLNA